MKKAMAALILFLMETLLFYLYEMPLEAWAYSSVFILLIFGGWIILDGVQQRKKYKQLKNIQKEAEVYLETEHFGKPENAVEKEYQNLAEMLGRQWENARQEARCQISEANRYYIRWSHQIKTPIAALRLLLEEEEPDRAAMEGEIYRIEQYVEFALQYQRLEGGHKDLVFAHYSLESIVKKALKKTGVLFRRTKLALELGNLQTDVLTDEKWLVFVLEQVLTNAVKYTRKGKISIYLDPEKEKTLVVEDTGMGIRPEDLPRIFEWGIYRVQRKDQEPCHRHRTGPVQTDHGNAGTSYFGKIRAGKRDMYLSGSCSRSSPGLLKTYTDVRLKKEL